MLLRFGVSNHQSIRDYQEINLTATTLKDFEEGLIDVVPIAIGGEGSTHVLPRTPKRKLRVVPVAAVLGANAAGKSTLLKALNFFVDGILSSHDRTASDTGTPFAPFRLNKESRKSPSRYDVDIVIDGTRYHYGYEVDGVCIVKEWLYSFPLTSERQVRTVLFFREKAEEEVVFFFGKSLKGDNKRISKLVRKNSLYLSTAAQNSHPQIRPIYDYFHDKFTTRIEEYGDPDVLTDQLTTYFGDDVERRAKALQFLRGADVGIVNFDFSKVPVDTKTRQLLADFEQVINRHVDKNRSVSFNKDEKNKVSLFHIGENGESFPISLRYESAGTLSLLQLLGPVFSRLTSGGVLIVDELNITLHPIVSHELIKLFSSPRTNPGKAQLLFSTHDTSVLTSHLLRRDQIWFAEKDEMGATSIFALSTIKVRSSDNIERGYLAGRFGAVPFFSEKALIWESGAIVESGVRPEI